MSIHGQESASLQAAGDVVRPHHRRLVLPDAAQPVAAQAGHVAGQDQRALWETRGQRSQTGPPANASAVVTSDLLIDHKANGAPIFRYGCFQTSLLLDGQSFQFHQHGTVGKHAHYCEIHPHTPIINIQEMILLGQDLQQSKTIHSFKQLLKKHSNRK